MSNIPLKQISVRLQPSVFTAVKERARAKGQEISDLVADLVAQAVEPDLAKDEAERLQAARDVKAEVLDFVRDETQRNGFRPDITLVAFQKIKADPRLNALYSKAIGNRPGNDTGNWLKANFNRGLGSAIKYTVGGRAQTLNGVKLEMRPQGEYIRTFSPLCPASD
jgi:hypothetical protein